MNTISDLKEGFQYGMHGCGFYQGVYHVNALEALRFWSKKGVHIMEIDIAKTCDDRFVALAHQMNDFYLKRVGINPVLQDEGIYTEKWYLNKRICPQTTTGLTPLSLRMIIKEMLDNQDLLVMFDLWKMWNKKDTHLFAQQLLDYANDITILDRCVLEVYNCEMLSGIRGLSRSVNVMYCVHGPQAQEFDENVNPILLKELGVNIISFPWDCRKIYPGEIEKYHKENFTIFSLSKDNRFSVQMKNLGVNVNLVDILYKPDTINSIYAAKVCSLFKRAKRKLLRFLGLYFNS